MTERPESVDGAAAGAADLDDYPKLDPKTGQWVNVWGLPSFQGFRGDAGLQQDGRFILELEFPIQLGERGEPRAELVFHPPKGKQMRTKPTAPQNAGDYMLWAAKLISPPLLSAEFDELTGNDCHRFEEVAVGFFSGTIGDIGCAPLEQLQRRFLPGDQSSS